MNLLVICRIFRPHTGGVEKHIYEVSKRLKIKNQNITILTEAYTKTLKDHEIINGIKIVRFSYPHIKFFGLLYIWFWFFKNMKMIKSAEVVHIHDVFIWYFPFCFIYPKKTVITTIHGFEWDSPLKKISILQKRLAIMFSNRTIGVGKFLEKYLNRKFDLISYGGATTLLYSNVVKKRDSIVYVGRLEENTGLLQFLNWLKKNKKYSVNFCGDGRMRSECAKFGKVHGFTDPAPFYKKAEYCVPGGYLAALEALSYKCKLKLFWNNKVKEDYWKLSPFYRLNGERLKIWAKEQTWEKLANEYISLYHNTK